MTDRCHVFYTAMPEGKYEEPLFEKERMREIEGCKSEAVKREKYYVWKLLELALKKAFNLDIANLKFTKLDIGKWVCDACFFSLSHTDGALAVSVSRHPTGVDIEKIRPVKAGLEEKILTDGEMAECSRLAGDERRNYILKCWCKKEAVFKMGEGTALLPKRIETDEYPVTATSVMINGREYMLAIASSCECELHEE